MRYSDGFSDRLDRPDGPKPTREGHVADYPRLRHSVWKLVLRALKASFPEER